MKKKSLYITYLLVLVNIWTIHAGVQGALPGAFSVSATKKVYFSQGNLQYQASTKTWRFAEHQYDVVGADNANISSTYDGWIDLFGWGTGNNPTKTTSSYTQYQTFYDWGIYNAIYNGGNTANLWRTLSSGEWGYLYNTRTSAVNLRSQGTVNGIHGYILLPDNWSLPSGISFTANAGNWTTNTYSLSKWNIMESAGAIFLPAAGFRNNYKDIVEVGSYGGYSSSTRSELETKYDFCFRSYYAKWNGVNYKHYGASVRLVIDSDKNVAYTITWKNWDGTTLTTTNVAQGATPSYTGSTPTRPSTAEYAYTFSGWTPALSAATANKTYTATYTQTLRKYSITVNSSNVSQGTAAGGGTYDYGTNHQITATPNECYRFVQWSDGNTDNPRTITVTGDATYTAEFEQIKYTIEALPDNPAQGSATVTNP